MYNEYKELNKLEDRINESTNILNKYNDKIPIILQKFKSKNINDIEKKKYLLPNDLSVSQFLFIIRKKIDLSPEQSIYLFCNNILLSSNSKIGIIYDIYKDDDKFLYLFYDSENTFGFK